MTREAFENAIRTLHAIGGSTNAVIHLLAIAGRLGVDLPLDLFDELAASTPLLANIKPSGAYLMEDFFYAGGLPGGPRPDRRPPPPRRADRDRPDVGEAILGRQDRQRRRDPAARPRRSSTGGSLAILRGNLCPDGAVLKVSAASPRLLQHEGRAVVFPTSTSCTGRSTILPSTSTPTMSSCSRTAGRSARPGMPEIGPPADARRTSCGRA